MKQFSKKVDLRNRKEMVEFLTSHFRYNTMNSWNNSTSYAHSVEPKNSKLLKTIVNILFVNLFKD